MGWKSTKTISRSKAMSLITDDVLYNLTDDELSDVLTAIGYGEKTDLKYYGHNFAIEHEEKIEIETNHITETKPTVRFQKDFWMSQYGGHHKLSE